MKILLVNDDGYQSEALMMLKEKMSKYGEVTVLAPEHAMSGKSVALTISETFKLVYHGDNVFSISGTPADCVSFGLTSLGVDFDLVVSGINYGHNVTYDTMHSGTCGACIEALMYSTPAIAFSMEYNHCTMINHLDSAMKYILDNNLISKQYFINVNFPHGEEVKGIKFTKLMFRNDKRYYINEDGTIYPKREICPDPLPEDSDVYAINNGYISICPMSQNVFSNEIYNNLKNDKNL